VKISQAIEVLQQLQREHGDVEVYVASDHDESPIHLAFERSVSFPRTVRSGTTETTTYPDRIVASQ
jgi:hypothetical protein